MEYEVRRIRHSRPSRFVGCSCLASPPRCAVLSNIDLSAEVFGGALDGRNNEGPPPTLHFAREECMNPAPKRCLVTIKSAAEWLLCPTAKVCDGSRRRVGQGEVTMFFLQVELAHLYRAWSL